MVPPPSPSPAPPPSLSSPPSFLEPSPHSLAYALFRRLSPAFRHRPSPALSAPSLSVLFGRTKALRSAKQCRKEEVPWGLERTVARELRGHQERAGAKEWRKGVGKGEGDGREGDSAGKGMLPERGKGSEEGYGAGKKKTKRRRAWEDVDGEGRRWRRC